MKQPMADLDALEQRVRESTDNTDIALNLISQVRTHATAVEKVLSLHESIWYDQWKHEMLSDYGHGGRCGLCLGFDGAACDTVLALGGFPDDE